MNNLVFTKAIEKKMYILEYYKFSNFVLYTYIFVIHNITRSITVRC